MSAKQTIRPSHLHRLSGLIVSAVIVLLSLASPNTALAAVSVSLSSPAPNTTVAAPGSLVLTATAASTNSTIRSVSFYRGNTLLKTDTRAPYTYTWSNVAAGTYSLTARVVDRRNARATSTAVSVTVINDLPPVVSLSSPAPNAVSIAPGNFTLSANASSVTSSIAKVEFYANATLLGSASAAPYTYAWSNVAAGNYSLTALATDALGASASSAPVSVTADQVPAVSVSSPAAGSQLAAGSDLTLAASASNPTSAIAQVDFYAYNLANNTSIPLGTATTAPYSIVWPAVPAGVYSLMAIATDVLGTAGTSLAVPISVNNPIARAYYIHTDHLDTPRQITDTGGTLVWQLENLFPFGDNKPDENPAGLGVFNFNLRFAGQYFDRETGTHYNIMRDYDPSTGRYVESDPIGLEGGINTYAYVEGNPLRWTDPTGLATYMCRNKLHALGGSGERSGPDISGNPLYHQSICVIDMQGNAICGGQDRSGGPWSPGKPSEGDGMNDGSCEEKEPDNRCIEQCVIKSINGPRPSYGLFGPGSNCQEWADDTLESCQKQCKGK